MNQVTRILSQHHPGDAQAAARLLPLVYRELRRLAAERLAHERPGQTLQTTALVHEAYLRLTGNDESVHWQSRSPTKNPGGKLASASHCKNERSLAMSAA